MTDVKFRKIGSIKNVVSIGSCKTVPVLCQGALVMKDVEAIHDEALWCMEERDV